MDMYPLLGCIFYCIWHIISQPTYQEKKNCPQETNESMKQIVDLIGTQERQEGTTTTTKKKSHLKCALACLYHTLPISRDFLCQFLQSTTKQSKTAQPHFLVVPSIQEVFDWVNLILVTYYQGAYYLIYLADFIVKDINIVPNSLVYYRYISKYILVPDSIL